MVLPDLRKSPEPRQETYDVLFTAYQAIFFLLPFAGGLFFTWQWCLAAMLHVGILLWRGIRDEVLQYHCSRISIGCSMLILCGAGWNLVFGVDPGAAFDGFLRLLATGGFCLLLMQWDSTCRWQLLRLLPFMGAAMVVVSFLAGLNPDWRPFWYENVRLAGPFQYANTFAVFLLAGLAVDSQLSFSAVHAAIDVLLMFGIVATGSRSTLLLLGLLLIYLQIKRRIYPLFWILVGVTVLLVGVCAVLNSGWVFTRFVDTGALRTLYGRLLYWKDGLRLLAQNPLGVGYLGWFYLQHMVQTGVYNVRFIHNDFLQCALDFGLPAAVAAVGWIVHRLRSQPCAPEAAIILCLHCLADPDLSFQWIVFVLLLALSPQADPPMKRIEKRRAAIVVLTVVSFFLFIPRGIGDAAFKLGDLPLACRLAPWDTELAAERMLSQDDLTTAARDAKKILERNPYHAASWQIMAEYAMACGAYDRMAVAQRQAVTLLKYDQDQYDRALARLQFAAQHSWEMAQAVQEMEWLLDRIDTTLAETDPLAWKLPDQPELSFPEQVRLMVHLMEK